METRFKDAGVTAIKADLLILPVLEKKFDESPLRALDRRLRGKLSERIQKSKFTGAEGSALGRGSTRGSDRLGPAE